MNVASVSPSSPASIIDKSTHLHTEEFRSSPVTEEFPLINDDIPSRRSSNRSSDDTDGYYGGM